MAATTLLQSSAPHQPALRLRRRAAGEAVEVEDEPERSHELPRHRLPALRARMPRRRARRRAGRWPRDRTAVHARRPHAEHRRARGRRARPRCRRRRIARPRLRRPPVSDRDGRRASDRARGLRDRSVGRRAGLWMRCRPRIALRVHRRGSRGRARGRADRLGLARRRALRRRGRLASAPVGCLLPPTRAQRRRRRAPLDGPVCAHRRRTQAPMVRSSAPVNLRCARRDTSRGAGVSVSRVAEQHAFARCRSAASRVDEASGGRPDRRD